jgi:serine/threonine protein kinase
MNSPSPFYCITCGTNNTTKATFCRNCGRPLQASREGITSSTSTGLLVPDHLLRQRYRILNLLGQGGMGAVYRAEDTHLGDRLVAVKEMRQSGMTPQEIMEATEAFQREAYMLAALQHPNLPSIYEHFYDVGLERWYLVMTFIEGETLEDHLGKAGGGHLPVKEVLDIGLQICTVLDYLHTHRPPIIFRDLKPTNVMLTNAGHLYLIDFGIARHFKPGQAKDTSVLGSPGYAAPEQHGKAQTSPRADIYSLGVTLHQLLTGNDPSPTPFRFTRLRLYDESIPSHLETLIMQMLEIDASKRPPSIASVKLVLQHIAAQQTRLKPSPVTPSQFDDVKIPPNRKDRSTNMDNQFSEASPPPPYQFEPTHTTGHPPNYPSHTTGYPPNYPPPPPPSKPKNKGYLIVIAVLVLLLAGVGGVEVIRSPATPQAVPAAQTPNTAPTSNATSQVTLTPTPNASPISTPSVTSGQNTVNRQLTCGGCDDPILVTIKTITINTATQSMAWDMAVLNKTGVSQHFTFTGFTLKDPSGGEGIGTGDILNAYQYGGSNQSLDAAKTAPGTITFSFVPQRGVSYTLTAQITVPGYNKGSDYNIVFDPTTFTF